MKNGNSNLYLNDVNLNNLLKSKTTDDFIEGSSNLFFTILRANSNITNYFNRITTDSIKDVYYFLKLTNKNFVQKMDNLALMLLTKEKNIADALFPNKQLDTFLLDFESNSTKS